MLILKKKLVYFYLKVFYNFYKTRCQKKLVKYLQLDYKFEFQNKNVGDKLSKKDIIFKF